MQAPVQTAPAVSPIRCVVFGDFSECDSFRKDWDAAVLSFGGSVYMTYDWCRTWWEFYGTGRQLRILVCYEDAKIVAIIPLYVDEIGFGFLNLRIARLVGSNIPPKPFTLAVSESVSAAVFRTILRQLFEQDRCDLISIGPVSTTQPTTDILERVCANDPDLVGRYETVTGVHSMFHLPADMEQYFESLSSKERKNRKYEARVMERGRVIKNDVVIDPSVVIEEFDQFAVQHAQQWRAEGRPGHFGSWPRALEFNRALVRRQAQQGRVRFIRILADNKVIANQFTFSFGDSYYWELPSRDIAPQWERISLGSAGALAMISAAIGEGKSRAEAGLASYEYKKRLGAVEYPTKIVRIVANRAVSLRRFKMFSAIRRGFEVGYHKIWYRRISPKLPPKFWRPQNMLWLRYDF